MKNVAVVILFVLALANCNAFLPNMNMFFKQQNYMQELMMQSYSAALSPSARITVAETDACFAYANTVQREINDRYNQEYKRCLGNAEESKAIVSAENMEQREDVLSRTTGVCNDLEACKSLIDGLEFFQCSYESTYKNYGILYGVSIESKDRLDQLTVVYQQIEYEKNVCVNKAYNVYVAELSASNDELQLCLKGLAPPPSSSTTDSTTTESTTTESTTTESTTTESTTTESTTTESTTESTTDSTTESTTTESTTQSTTVSSTTEEIERSPEEDLGRSLRFRKLLTTY